MRTARSGNAIAGLAMLLAMLATLVHLGRIDYRWILAGVAVGGLIGAIAAIKVEMTSMPEMVALFNGFGGIASTLVALSVFWPDWWSRGQHTPAQDPPGHLGGHHGPLDPHRGRDLHRQLIAFAKLAGKVTGNPSSCPAGT